MHKAEIYWQTLGFASHLRSESPGRVTCLVRAAPAQVHTAIRSAGASFVRSVAMADGSCARHFTFSNGGYAIMDGVRPDVLECTMTLFESTPKV